MSSDEGICDVSGLANEAARHLKSGTKTTLIFMVKRFPHVLKERAGIEKLTREQIRGIKELLKESSEWDEMKAGEYAKATEKMSGKEYDKLWDVNLYIISDVEKEKLKNLDQKTIFNNMLWLSRNTDKIDENMGKFLGMHVWVVNYWITTIGATTVRKFLRDNGYSGDFVYFLYKYFNL